MPGINPTTITGRVAVGCFAIYATLYFNKLLLQEALKPENLCPRMWTKR